MLSSPCTLFLLVRTVLLSSPPGMLSYVTADLYPPKRSQLCRMTQQTKARLKFWLMRGYYYILTEHQKHFLMMRFVRQWNCLPRELAEALLLQSFVITLYKIFCRQQFQDKTRVIFSLQDFCDSLHEPWVLAAVRKPVIFQPSCLDCSPVYN